MRILRLTILSLVILLVGLFCVHSLGPINQDIGRHIKTGEIIWQTHAVPKTNLFSFTEAAAPFINHHWGSEVIFYLLNSAGGLTELILFKAAVFSAAFLLLYLAVSGEVGIIPFTIASVAGLLVIADRTDVRPEIFSYLFLAYFLFAIFRSKYRRQDYWLYALPVVELLWANMHIYFPLGFGLIGLYGLGCLVRRDPRWKTVAWITAASAAAIMINPSGIRGALEPFTILANYGYSIVENQGILFLKNYGILLTQINIFLFITILFGLSYIPAIKKYGFKNYIFELGAGVVFAGLAMDMIRNFGPYAIALVPIAALNLAAYKPLGASRKSAGVATIVLLLFLIWATISSNLFAWTGQDGRFGVDIPASAQGGVDFVLANHIAGPVFNNFDVGSYLIWKLYPDQKVFVDGRPEAYPANFFSDIYEPMQEDPQTFNHYADDIYHINYIFFDYRDITPWAQTFLSWIGGDNRWPLVYRDDSIAIFVRRIAQNQAVIQKYSR